MKQFTLESDLKSKKLSKILILRSLLDKYIGEGRVNPLIGQAVSEQ